jgi:regulatory protein
LDGKWAFNLPLSVVEKWGMVQGMEISAAGVEELRGALGRQAVLDKGLAILSRRLHSRAELKTKLGKGDFAPEQVEAALDELQRLGYVDDAKFARTKAQASADYRKHGRRRAYVELIKAGVEKETARRASEEVFEASDSLKVARELAAKKAPSLLKLDQQTARRRLTGMLLRRGFSFEEIRPVLDEVLGSDAAWVVAEAEPKKVDEMATEEVSEEEEEKGVEAKEEEGGGNWRSAMLPAHMRKKEKSRRSGFGWGRRGGGLGGKRGRK